MALDLTSAPTVTAAPARTAETRRSLALPPLLQRFNSQRIGARERMHFTERLALLLDTGVSLHEALHGLHRQTLEPELHRIIGEVSESILEGSPLSGALAKHPEMFSLTYVNLVSAAERGGFLPEVLRQLIEMDEKTERMRSMLVAALSYPALLTSFSLATILFVLVSVFPRFAVMFERIRDDLPLSTIVLMSVSDLLVNHWPWALGATALVAVFGWTALRQPTAREWIDGAKLRLPVLRQLYSEVYLTQTLRVLSLSLANGVPLVESLRASQDLVRNVVFCRFIDEVRNQVTEGRGIANAFRAASFVPPLVQQMVTTGEETGNLAKVMSRIADFYERELTKRIGMITRMAEPVMLLVMGSVVGIIVASLILPIFKLSRAVN